MALRSDPSDGKTTLAEDTAEHLRTQFLRRVAHDIASPVGVAATVLDELATAESPAPELVAMAKRSLQRLMRLSGHLALAAELEAEGVVPELGPLDVRPLARRALDEAIAIDGRRGVAVHADLPTSPLIIAGDPRLLATVLREVVGNALKLATSRVEVTVSSTPDGAMIRVDDDGPGFAEESTKTLGRRFVKREATRGLGLSLSMAVDILRAHDGDLSVHASALPPSRRGAIGAAVVIRLPSIAKPERVDALTGC